MVLGTFHLASPQTNRFNAETESMMSERRQQELDRLADRLAAWCPTIVAVEIEPPFEAEYRESYDDWRAGGESRGWPDEYAQIAFRVLDRVDGLGASDLEAIDRQDWNWPAPEEEALTPDSDPALAALMAKAKSSGQSRADAKAERLSALNLTDLLAERNSPEAIRASDDYEMRYQIRFYQDDNPGGAHSIARFYERNLLIFQNLLKALEERGTLDDTPSSERVLIIYGHGHAFDLGRLVDQSPYTYPVSSGTWLSGATSEGADTCGEAAS